MICFGFMLISSSFPHRSFARGSLDFDLCNRVWPTLPWEWAPPELHRQDPDQSRHRQTWTQTEHTNRTWKYMQNRTPDKMLCHGNWRKECRMECHTKHQNEYQKICQIRRQNICQRLCLRHGGGHLNYVFFSILFPPHLDELSKWLMLNIPQIGSNYELVLLFRLG